ncbi:hypothetical protein V8G54_029696 [Vigna mungo]|uniref:Uncharacterized protein n=1 Tax=Vigna mungo TaxID=3915 RepID=A0AAQ3MVH4_VIGMU
MQCHNRSRRCRLPESDVGNRTAPTEDTHPTLAAASELGDAFGDVCATGNLHDMASEGVWAVLGDKDWWFGLVLGARWSPSGPASSNLDSTLFGFIAVVSIFFLFIFSFSAEASLVDGKVHVTFV